MKYVLGIGGSDCDDVKVSFIEGSKSQIKNYIISLIQKMKKENESYEYGSEDIDEISEIISGKLYGYACFAGYHIDITATPVEKMEYVSL